jgi:ATP-binding cassette, subfamily B, multidrug efflux pump
VFKKNMATTKKQKKLDYGLLGKVLRLAAPYKGKLIFTGILACILSILAVFRPFLIEKMIDEHVLKNDVPGMNLMLVAIFASLVTEVIFRYFFLYNADWMGQAVIRDLRTKAFSHINSLNLTYFDRTPVGQSTTRVINDVEAINTIFAEGSITIVSDLLNIFVVLGFMLMLSWKLTLIVLAVFPLLIIGSYYFKESVRVSYESVRNHIATMNSFLQERITGMKILQIFNAERQEAERFKKINRDYTRANLDAINAYAVFFPVVDIISAISLGLMVWYGAGGVLRGEVTLGTLIAFPLYISMLYRPIRMLADKFNTLQMGLIAAERVFKLLESGEKIDNKGTFSPEKLRGEIEFKNVDFEYVEDNPILKNLNFKINAGQTLAIVGSTGSGKTTIISILNRFYEIKDGQILVDGRDIREHDLFNLRRRIAVVLQDVFLFSGTVLENITLRDASISREKAIESAKMIGAHEFIMRLPGGYDYQVQERGATLSMGQRQLISFVRALVFEPDILVLDEATSSIDPETESVIQFAIEKLIARRTSIIIAHRLSTIRHASRILVMQRGEAIEFGTHEQLVSLENGRYRELYEMQFLQVAA